MKYVLDTDTLVHFLKGDRNVIETLANHAATDLSTTMIKHSELLFGVFNSAKKKENFKLISGLLKTLTLFDYCEESSMIFAEQKALLKRQGNLVADMDLMIASITLRHKATLVTNNTRHFARINGLKLENWT
jgi:tRNA(fMet)-specific endonuclease VapC